MKPDKETRSPNILALTRWFNQVWFDEISRGVLFDGRLTDEQLGRDGGADGPLDTGAEGVHRVLHSCG
jgi:hypothetical protein